MEVTQHMNYSEPNGYQMDLSAISSENQANYSGEPSVHYIYNNYQERPTHINSIPEREWIQPINFLCKPTHHLNSTLRDNQQKFYMNSPPNYFENSTTSSVNMSNAKYSNERVEQWNFGRGNMTNINEKSAFIAIPTVSDESAFTKLSVGSNHSLLSSLSICTDVTDPVFMYSPTSSSASCVEKMNPTDTKNIEMVIDQHCSKLASFNNASMDISELENLATKMYELAVEWNFSYVRFELINTYIISMMYIIKCKPRSAEIIRKVLSIIYIFSTKDIGRPIFSKMLEKHTDEVFDIFLPCLSSEHYYCNFAAIIVHTLLVQAYDEKVLVTLATRKKIMDKVLLLLRSYSPGKEHCLREKIKHIIIDTLRVLVFRHNELKKYFVEEKAVEILLWFLTSEANEQVLYFSALAIRYLLNYPDKTIAEYCASIDGVQIFTDKLSHGSPRLLLECAKCLSAMSDADCLQKMDLNNSLEKIIKLFGSSDNELVKHLLGFVGNVASTRFANFPNMNKVHLINSDILRNLVRVLVGQNPYLCQTDYEVVEYAVFALKNLTSNFPLKANTLKVRNKFIRIDGSLSILYDHLSYHMMKPQSDFQSKIMTTQVDIKINLLSILQRLFDSNFELQISNARSVNGDNLSDVLYDLTEHTTELKFSFPQHDSKLERLLESISSLENRLLQSRYLYPVIFSR